MLFFGVGMLIETRVVSPSHLCGECQFVVFSLFQAVACSLREWSYCFRLLWPTVVFFLWRSMAVCTLGFFCGLSKERLCCLGFAVPFRQHGRVGFKGGCCRLLVSHRFGRFLSRVDTLVETDLSMARSLGVQLVGRGRVGVGVEVYLCFVGFS